jgi:hypothetical protein
VEITDSTGCARQLVYVITSPPALSAVATITHTTCSLDSIALSVTGGTQPYNYLWSTGAVAPNLGDLASGTYSVVITDANGCTLQKSVTIDVVSLTCLINQPSAVPTCHSIGNLLTTPVSDADSYQWQVTSNDGSWVIQSGALTDTLVFTAGNENTSATFTLTLTKDGCTQSCTFVTTACTGTSVGGSNDESCGDCFSSSISRVSEDGGCASYHVTFSTDGNCRYDLSHLVIAIPCGEISNYSDTGGWPLVVGKDPTTGLTGLKVDNVSNFGKQRGSFGLSFTVCGSANCVGELEDWNPVVAYKAGQCIAYDTLSFNQQISYRAYPNPFNESIHFEVVGQGDESVHLEIYDQYGKKVLENDETRTVHGETKTISVEGSGLRENLYFYRIRTKSKVSSGMLLKGR